MKLLKWTAGLVAIGLIFIVTVGHHLADRMMNGTLEHTPFQITDEARSLHSSLTIMDWHTDTMMWERDFFKRHNYGHVDLPRLQEGNLGLMMMTAVTKSPSGQNYVKNEGDSDRLNMLHRSQLWPIRTWDSLLERALYQAEKLDTYIQNSGGQMVWVKNKSDLMKVLANQQIALATGKTSPTGFLLGAEGGHPLEGKIENIDRMIEVGYRMIGITHFFDNELGGSLHGTSRAV